MFEKWISLEENFGKQGSELGTIKIDDEIPGLARITIEEVINRSTSRKYYAITMGVQSRFVHTAFFNSWEDALECAEAIKITIQVLI